MVYNTMDSLMKWTPKIERNLKSRMEMRFRRFGETKVCGAVKHFDPEFVHMCNGRRIIVEVKPTA